MLAADWDTTVAIGRDQVKEGAHVLDVCVDYTGADGVADMTEVASRLATQASVPLMVDSTEAPVVEAALMWIGGRPDPQLGQPRGGRRTRHPARQVPDPGPRVRRRGGVHLHRHRGPGPHRRLEGPRRHGHPRHRRGPLRPRALGPHLRPLGAAAVDGHGGEPARRDRDPRGHPPDQVGAARGLHHRRACPTCRSGSTPRPATSSTRCSSTSSSRPGSTRPSSTRRASSRCRRSTSAPARSASTSSTTAAATATTRSRSSWPSSRASRATSTVTEDRTGWTVEHRLEQRIIDGDRNGLEDDLAEALGSGHEAAHHRQRLPPGRDEDGGRALRHRARCSSPSSSSRPRP